MACPSLIIDDKNVILLSGFESEAGKLTAVTAERELLKAASKIARPWRWIRCRQTEAGRVARILRRLETTLARGQTSSVVRTVDRLNCPFSLDLSRRAPRPSDLLR
jgi:hypothetical protein